MKLTNFLLFSKGSGSLPVGARLTSSDTEDERSAVLRRTGESYCTPVLYIHPASCQHQHVYECLNLQWVDRVTVVGRVWHVP